MNTLKKIPVGVPLITDEKWPHTRPQMALWEIAAYLENLTPPVFLKLGNGKIIESAPISLLEPWGTNFHTGGDIEVWLYCKEDVPRTLQQNVLLRVRTAVTGNYDQVSGKSHKWRKEDFPETAKE